MKNGLGGTRLHIIMPPGLLADLDQRASASYLSRSDYIRIALMEKMKRQNMVDYPETLDLDRRAKLSDDPEGIYWPED